MPNITCRPAALALSTIISYFVSGLAQCLISTRLVASVKAEQVARQRMVSPDYVKILKLDKLAMKAKTREEFLKMARTRLPYAKNLGVVDSFSFFVDRAWEMCGDGK